jgi:CO/xanthine dehydrogenase FAD-binding subunit
LDLNVKYHAPTTVSELLQLMSATPADAPARPLAGGSDLIVQMGSGRVQPTKLVDMKRIPDLVGIKHDSNGWHIGAATPIALMGEHAQLRAVWPGVVEAATLIGSKQVQGRGTIAGNLCNASPAADSVPALIAAGAIAVVGCAGADGKVTTREIAVESIPKSPGRTNLATNEVVLSIRLPNRSARAADAYLRLTPRTEMDIAVVGCGVSLELDAEGCVTAARVGLGAVAPTALLVPAAAEALVGSKLEAEALARMEAAVRAACRPIDDKRGTAEYRIQVAGVLARRAATIAQQRAMQRNAQEKHA